MPRRFVFTGGKFRENTTPKHHASTSDALITADPASRIYVNNFPDTHDLKVNLETAVGRRSSASRCCGIESDGARVTPTCTQRVHGAARQGGDSIAGLGALAQQSSPPQAPASWAVPNARGFFGLLATNKLCETIRSDGRF